MKVIGNIIKYQRFIFSCQHKILNLNKNRNQIHGILHIYSLSNHPTPLRREKTFDLDPSTSIKDAKVKKDIHSIK